MTQQGVRWTTDQVLALAPDASSRKAGSKLGAAGPWSQTGSSDEGAVWGQCKGSGSKPYQTIVDTGAGGGAGPAYKCTCPSRKFPCKHALGLLLLWAGGEQQVPAGQEAPEWAEQWLAGRRERAATKRTAQAAPGADAGAAAADPEAARRRAERRAQRITAGATELEQRLTDLLRGGLAQAEQSGYGLWEETAARMVDAQAPGLAARVRELGAIPGSGPGWPVRLLEECALLHLLVQGWLHRAELPADLATTVRSRVGLPASASQAAVRDDWLVLAQYDAADGHLTTRRIWLYGTGSRRTVLLLSYGAAGRAPSLALPAGLTVDAVVSGYPGARTLRAELGEQFGAARPMGPRPTGVDVAAGLAAYGEALAEDPWLESWPVTLADVVPARDPDGGGWQLADAEGKAALPLTSQAVGAAGLWRLVAVSGGGPVTVFGECGFRGFRPLAVWSGEAGEVVSLC
ncbi:SWIM zinc finger family protein [Streptomyces sp. VRA16 Mangrove soil]|uniref:SWIM zinc finger family protein n=1 Tax=Streptomyces sp. VRA16 Mangrove soil TaxID=2817434 RepID=UPI001A9EF369|nr:SWIM zinc finger family protein [Streptomyces sp. VRA16 Mangrove soil]MBO1335133.1 SWIM zinc finger family protein [Streptomyces sp. VRA16 Mangrove soil]